MEPESWKGAVDVRRFVTVDVFTDQLFAGNPLAVILDARGLTSEQMQAIAREFNYIESTFVLPPDQPDHTARLRIFTPAREVPFAGHPSIGTAFALACAAVCTGGPELHRVTFEQAAGVVPVDVTWQAGRPVGAQLMCPEPLSRGAVLPVEQAAACLSLVPAEIRTVHHPAQVASVGLPILIVEVASRDALRRARLDAAAYRRAMPLDGARALYPYTHDSDDAEADLEARMFTSFMAEDPATGSATGALAALLAELRGSPDLTLRVRQGVDMGRPSTLTAHVVRESDGLAKVKLSGACTSLMTGEIRVT